MTKKEYIEVKHQCIIDEYKRDRTRVELSNMYSKIHCNIMPDLDDYEYLVNPIDSYLVKKFGIEYAENHRMKTGIYKKNI